MKAFFALVCLLSLNSAFAQFTTELTKGDLNISQAQAQILSVSPICPASPDGTRCMAYGSTVQVKITMDGCMDRLGGYFSKFEEVNGKGVLHFGAMNIFNKTSMVVRCVQIPSETISVDIPFEGEVDLVEMPFTGTKLN